MKHKAQRHRRRLAALLAATAVSALVLTACSAPGANSETESPSDGTPVKGGNLVVQISGDPGTLDMNASPSVNTHYIANHIYERLFELDAKNVPKPQLVDKYEVSKDNLEYTFHLRDGVVFSDGTPFTANDAVASVEYWMGVNASTGKVIKAEFLDSMTAKDDLTIVLKLKKPRYPLLAELAGNGVQMMKASTAETLTPKGFQNDQVMGTGPYKLKSWTPTQELVLERNDLYKSRPASDKESGAWGAKAAYLDTITYKMVPENSAIVNGTITGEWQFASSPQESSYEELKNTTGIKVATQAGGHLNVLSLNYAFEGSIFYDQKARDALNLVVDKKALLAVSGGPKELTHHSGSITVKSSPVTYSDAGDKEYNKYDPKKAAKLFKEAGYTDDKPIQILTTNDFPQFMQWSTLIQDQLKAIGIKSDIRSYDFVTMLAQWQQYPDQWDIVPLYFNGDIPTPSQTSVLQSSATEASATAPAIPDKRPQALVDAIEKYNTITSEKEAHELWNEFTKQLWEYKPVIILGMSLPYAAYTDKLHGYNDYWDVFYNSWLEK